ncbi:PREDICTED: vacuolar fusion protein MON1 homolog A [Rhagoletis zephyria]|uniref:vacuolar fusion protein MON1 homolog A n=1 Tax=Rhagoletis zephyria TaxID=28612 RepID=UPI00081161DD|nr:PREDICTED: vacuolar fusion protein MON1 homolog A [Rhagoletis zephyria]
MDVEPPTNYSDAASVQSNSEYSDAECEPQLDDSDYFHDTEREASEPGPSVINVIREGLTANGESDSISKNSNSNAPPNVHKSTSAESLPISNSTSTVSGEISSSLSAVNVNADEDYEVQDDYMHDSVWCGQKKHIFILSEAGKPIYSLHGNEDKLATLFGVIQALVSFVQHGQDAITSIHANGIKFVFLTRNTLILVAASRTNMSVPQLQHQLSDVYNQILSTLTYKHVTRIFEKRKNFDLRRSLAGSERLIYHLLSNDSSNKRVTNNVFTFLTNSIRVMPLSTTVRSNIVSAIQSNCSKIKDLVFAVLIANNKLISLVRMKKYSIHPADLRLIFNLIECSESFKASENWTPICLPKFDMNGYLYAHVSYLTDDCQACLLLLSVDPNVFFTLSDAKRRITEKLRSSKCLEAISKEIEKPTNGGLNLTAIGIPELRHFLYKPKAAAQLLCSELAPPYSTLSEFERLEGIYCDLLHRIHNSSRPLKLIYEVHDREVVLAWVTAAYELYAVFEPLVDKCAVIKNVDKLIKWIEKEYDIFFIRNHPTF